MYRNWEYFWCIKCCWTTIVRIYANQGTIERTSEPYCSVKFEGKVKLIDTEEYLLLMILPQKLSRRRQRRWAKKTKTQSREKLRNLKKSVIILEQSGETIESKKRISRHNYLSNEALQMLINLHKHLRLKMKSTVRARLHLYCEDLQGDEISERLLTMIMPIVIPVS